MTRRRARAIGAAAFVASVLGVGMAYTPAHAAGSAPASKGSLAKAAEETPKAIMPCFETLPDGSTRVFVELSKPIAYQAKPAQGSMTYVLKGVRVERRNNFNPLVTTFFNTPVTTAQLVPRGHDVWLELALRASVEPVVTMDTNADGGAVLSIQFPKGDYLPPSPPHDPAFESPATPAAADPAQGAAPATSAAPAPRPIPANRPRSGGGHSRRRGAGGS